MQLRTPMTPSILRLFQAMSAGKNLSGTNSVPGTLQHPDASHITQQQHFFGACQGRLGFQAVKSRFQNILWVRCFNEVCWYWYTKKLVGTETCGPNACGFLSLLSS